MPIKIRVMTIAIAAIAGIVTGSIVYLTWGAVAAWMSRKQGQAGDTPDTDDEQTSDQPK